jgi:hypothetical protein
MKLFKFITAIMMLLPILGCPTTSPHYLEQPKVIDTAGPFIHEKSGMTFPQTVNDFRRSSIRRYDAEGFDMSVGYDLFDSSRAIASTVYIYPAPQLVSIGSPVKVVASARANLCRGEFEGRKQEIVQAHPGAKLIGEKDVSLVQAGVIYTGKMATFEYEDIFINQRQTIEGRVYLFCYVSDKWVVKYRFSYPKRFDAENEIDGFLRSLSWTITNS